MAEELIVENEMKPPEQIKLPQDFQALIAGFFPNTKYFDSGLKETRNLTVRLFTFAFSFSRFS